MKSKTQALGRICKEFPPRGNVQLFQLDKPATFTCSLRKVDVTSCLFRAGIPAEKPAVIQALQTGALRPGKHPTNYGKQTHAELCRWSGMDTTTLPSP